MSELKELEVITLRVDATVFSWIVSSLEYLPSLGITTRPVPITAVSQVIDGLKAQFMQQVEELNDPQVPEAHIES